MSKIYKRRILPNNWNWRKISDFAKTASGGTPKSTNKAYYEDGTIPWINSGELNSPYISTTTNFITIEGLKNSSAKLFPVNSVLVALYGATAGKASLLKIEATTNQAVCAILPNENYDPLFLKFSIDSLYSYLIKISTGSARDNLSQDIIKELQIGLPVLKQQQHIATVLSSLDDKIELNNRINTELEAMAKTLYDYWFVQFDFPNEEGKPYKSSGGKMVYNEKLKREIPEGWKVKNLREINTDIIRGVTYNKTDIKKRENKGVIGILRATNITGNKIDLDDLVYVDISLVSEKQLLQPFDLIITMSSGSKDHIGKNGFYYFTESNSFGAFCAKIDIVSKYKFLLSTYFQSQQFKSYVENICLGTNINNLNNEHIKAITHMIPCDVVLDKYNNILSPIYQKIARHTMENKSLASLRDWLLPMLMNGQVGFKEEKQEKAKTIDLVVEQNNKSDKTYSLPEIAILAGYIISQNENQDFGRTKLMKLLFLTEYHCQLNINKDKEQLYLKNVAGPHNDRYIKDVEDILIRYYFYKIQKEKRSTKKDIVRYNSNNREIELQSLFYSNFSEKAKSIDNILSLMKRCSWSACEIIATLYAIWNNRIIRKEKISIPLLLEDFYNWSEHKHDYTKAQVLAGLAFMKKKNIIPIGFGEYIDMKKER